MDYLILQCTTNSEDASLIKMNINNIANNLQDQSEKLINLKGQQQELVRDSYRI